MRYRCAVLLSMILFLTVSPLDSIPPAPGNRLPPGPHAVGFSVMETLDGTRTFLSSPARAVRIYLWYPAAHSNDSPMTFKKYLDLANTDFIHSQGGPGEYDPAIPIVRGLSPEDLEHLARSETGAVLNGRAEEGKFPLVLVGQGLYYESPVTHSLLCEFLASHGYVVATCPLTGTDSRFVRLNPVDLDTQVRDLEFVMDRVRRMGNVNPADTGFLGFDMGGMAGLVFAMKNPTVKAFLSMDAGILFPHSSNLPGSSPHYNEDKFVIPWMHLTQRRFYHGAKERNPDLLSLYDRKGYGDSYLFLFDGVTHASFTSYAMVENKNAVPAYWGPDSTPEKKPSSGEIYRIICRMAGGFFDRYLKENPKALDFVKMDCQPPLPGIPVTVQYKKGTGAPLCMDDFIGIIFDEGIERAVSLVKDELKISRKLRGFSEPDINRLGYKFLYFWGRPEAAVSVFLLNARLYPESGNVYDSLGEAYLVSGDRELAVKNYQKSLKLDPRNNNAREQLKRLQAGP